MNVHPSQSMGRTTACLVTIFIVFGLAGIMVLKRYDPAVITSVVTGTSLAAAELIRRLQASNVGPPRTRRDPEERS